MTVIDESGFQIGRLVQNRSLCMPLPGTALFTFWHCEADLVFNSRSGLGTYRFRECFAEVIELGIVSGPR